MNIAPGEINYLRFDFRTEREREQRMMSALIPIVSYSSWILRNPNSPLKIKQSQQTEAVNPVSEAYGQWRGGDGLPLQS